MINMIILIAGDFAVGKDTFADELNTQMHYRGMDSYKILSKTTRNPRYKDENTHIFTDKLEYQIYKPEDIINNRVYDVDADDYINPDLLWNLNEVLKKRNSDIIRFNANNFFRIMIIFAHSLTFICFAYFVSSFF